MPMFDTESGAIRRVKRWGYSVNASIVDNTVFRYSASQDMRTAWVTWLLCER